MMISSSSAGYATPLDASIEHTDAIGRHILIHQPQHDRDDIENILTEYKKGAFNTTSRSVINFGLDAKPLWLAIRIQNPETSALYRSLLIENAWLDELNLYFLHDDRLIEQYRAGDSLPFSQRQQRNHRFFIFDHAFESGETLILMQIKSIDANVIPIYFFNNDQLSNWALWQTFSYGFFYGVILALIAYNLLLFIGLRISPHLFYALYLLTFLALNIAYTGHGYQWLWPESPRWQQWSNPVFILICIVSGFKFALFFLNIKETHLRIYHTLIACCIGFTLSIGLTILTDSLKTALLISTAFALFFNATIVMLGIISWHVGNKFAKYFLLATSFSIGGGIITTSAIWGWIPFNELTYRAVEIGMMLDAILLALALAERFNINQHEKLAAEKMAGIDSLTNLNNRRAFYKFVQPIWAMSTRSRSNTSVIILDVDNFKILNDRHGHAFGDHVLINLAEALQKEARSGDILARWGGEEFLIFLPETRLTDAVMIADRIRKKISTIRLTIDEQAHFSVTASFGVATTHDMKISLDELISRADQQLYRAKQLGRNRVCMDLPD